MSLFRFYISFHAYLKNSVYSLKFSFIKTRVLSNVTQTKRFKIDILIYLKTLPKYQKRKEQKNIGFWAQNGEPTKALANRLNRLRYQLTDFLCPVEVQSRSAKNTFFFFLVAFPFRSTSGRGSVEATITCQNIKCSNGQ